MWREYGKSEIWEPGEKSGNWFLIQANGILPHSLLTLSTQLLRQRLDGACSSSEAQHTVVACAAQLWAPAVFCLQPNCFGYPLSIFFIVINEFCERFSYYGMRGTSQIRHLPVSAATQPWLWFVTCYFVLPTAVLVLYFKYFLRWDDNFSTAIYHTFVALCYLTPILGALIADSWLGKFKSVLILPSKKKKQTNNKPKPIYFRILFLPQIWSCTRDYQNYRSAHLLSLTPASSHWNGEILCHLVLIETFRIYSKTFCNFSIDLSQWEVLLSCNILKLWTIFACMQLLREVMLNEVL